MRHTTLALLFFAACASDLTVGAQAQGVHIGRARSTSPAQTSGLVFSRSAGDTIRTAFVNGPSSTVYLLHPFVGIVTLERCQGGEWVDQPVPYGRAAVVAKPRPLGPHQYEPLWELKLNDFDHVEPGTYRVQAYVFADPSLERLLPESQRVSSVFEIVE